MRFSTFLLILISSIFIGLFPIQVHAQSCGGSYTCPDYDDGCPVGCTDLTCPGQCSPFCDFSNPITVSCSSFSESICDSISASNGCDGYGCGAGISGGCAWSAPTCGPSNCFDRACTDGSGNACTCYGVCSGGSCVTGGVKVGSCSSPPTCTADAFISGTHCVSETSCYDTYCNSSGTGTVDNYYSGSACAACAAVPTTSGPTDVPTVAPTTPDCGAYGGCAGTQVWGWYNGACQCYYAPPVPTEPPGGCFFGVEPYSTCQNYACTVINGSCGFSNCTSNSDCSCGDGTCQSSETASSCPNDCTNTLDGRVYIDLNENQSYDPAESICPVSNSSWFPSEVRDCTFSGYSVCGSFAGATSQCYNDNGGSGLTSWDEFCPPSYTIAQCQSAGFTVCTGGPFGCFDDNNSNNTYDAIGDTGVANPTLNLSPANSGTLSTTGTGRYTFPNVPIGNHTLTLTVPNGYVSSVANNVVLPMTADTAYDFPLTILTPPPACVPGAITLNPSGGTANPGGDVTLSVTSCTDVENPDNSVAPPPFSWNPDTGGNNPPPTVGVSTDTPTSSTVIWTAPVCPASQTTYTPRVTVAGAGGTTDYSTSITVPSTVGITANVLSVASGGACGAGAGPAYQSGGVGANLHLTGGGGTVNQNQTTNGGTGQASFTCLPQGNYTLTLTVPAGYGVTGTSVAPAVETLIGTNGLSFATGTSNQVAYFCIAPIDPWFQTDKGDVRMTSLANPVPTGLYASSDATYPGVLYSSDSNADFGDAGETSASIKEWIVNNEYSYNADTENKNGGMSYDFFKSKVRQDGVTCPTDVTKSTCTLTPGALDTNQITGTGVYEADGDLAIDSYTHVSGRRIVILVNGNVKINTPISVPSGQGLFIVAAKGNITIDDEVGTADPIDTTTLNSTTSHLDGYYTAQGSIIVESVGLSCADGTTTDRRLNVGGALVANSLKPFSTTGTGTIQNDRSLCLNNLLYPSLYVSSRLDFLTQLTDFYKISYTKWQEVKP